MMKRNCNYLAGFAILLLLGAAFPVSAQTGGNSSEAQFCRDIKSLSSKVLGPIQALSRDAITTQTTKLTELAALRADRDAKKVQERAYFSKSREEQFKTLEERAETDTQKGAVVKFRTAIDAAVATRTRVIDAALASFRIGLDRSTGTWQSGVTAATDTFVATVQKGIERAEANCMKGTGVARSTFQKTLRDARTTFQKTVDALATVRSSVDTLTVTRNKAFDKAQADFMIAVEKAVQELKKVFPDA